MSSCLPDFLVDTTVFSRYAQRLKDGASALALGARGPGFKSRRPDKYDRHCEEHLSR